MSDTDLETQRADKGADRNADTELGKLMHDFSCTKADDMNYKELSDKVRYFKENEEGRNASGGRMFCADRSEAEKEDYMQNHREQRSLYAGLVNQQ